MSVRDGYNVKVKTGTRNLQGTFVQESSYKLIGIEQSGWALICSDGASCCFVDPDNLQSKTHIPKFPFCNYSSPYNLLVKGETAKLTQTVCAREDAQIAKGKAALETLLRNRFNNW